MKISDYSMLEILQAAEIETAQSGSQTVCRCPVCKSGEPLGKGNHEAQVNDETLYCHCCSKTYTRTEIIESLDLYSALDIKKWEDRPAVPRIKAEPEMDKPVSAVSAIPAMTAGPKTIIKKTVFEHKDIDGKVLYKKERIDFIDGSGKSGKNIFYKEKDKDQPVVFYGLETLQDAADISQIMLVEGEKCVDALRIAIADSEFAINTAVLGLVKASEWEYIGKEAQDIILSKKIIIFQDNDAPGKKNTDELLKYFKKPVTVIDFNDKPKAYDIADWILKDGGDIAGAMKKYERTVTPVVETDPDARPASQIKSVPPEFILKDYLPLVKNDINMLAAFGGHGKTWIALNCAILTALSGMKVKYWIREASAGYLRYRLDLLLPLYREKNISDKSLSAAMENLFLADAGKPFDLSNKTCLYDIVILDPYLSFFTGDDENKNKQNRDFIEPFIQFAAKTKTTFLFLHHAGKNKDTEYQARGASAIIDSFHNVWEIEKISDSEKKTGFNKHTERVIVNKKDNMGVQAFGIEHKIEIKPSLILNSDDINDENEENQTFKENSNDKKDEDIPENWI